MCRAVTGLTLFCLIWAILSTPTNAQQHGQPGGIGFRNELKVPVLVEGASVVNGMLRRGQPIRIAPGQMAWDCNLSPGLRYLTIYDANQPTRILYRDPPIPFQGKDLFYGVRPLQTQRDRVQLINLPLPAP